MTAWHKTRPTLERKQATKNSYGCKRVKPVLTDVREHRVRLKKEPWIRPDVGRRVLCCTAQTCATNSRLVPELCPSCALTWSTHNWGYWGYCSQPWVIDNVPPSRGHSHECPSCYRCALVNALTGVAAANLEFYFFHDMPPTWHRTQRVFSRWSTDVVELAGVAAG